MYCFRLQESACLKTFSAQRCKRCCLVLHQTYYELSYWSCRSDFDKEMGASQEDGGVWAIHWSVRRFAVLLKDPEYRSQDNSSSVSMKVESRIARSKNIGPCS